MKKPSSKCFERAGQKQRVCMVLEITKQPNEKAMRLAIVRVGLLISRECQHLSTADKNRLLLAVHASVGEHLAALETSTE